MTFPSFPKISRPKLSLSCPKLPLKSVLALSLALAVSGCESFSLDNFNPFDTKKPLPGQRAPVFPEGVPGVDYSARYSQPSNSNTPIENLPAQQPKPGQAQKPAQQ